MSRTYRCRHLPAARDGYGVLISRISDGARGYCHRRVQQDARAQVEAEFGPRPSPDRVLVRAAGRTHPVYIPGTRSFHNYFIKGLPAVGWWQSVPARHEDRPGVWMKTWEGWAWGREVDRRLSETAVPISYWHPLQRHHSVGGRKKRERVQANRNLRHVTNQCIRTLGLNWEDDLLFPVSRNYFDWWSIY